MRLSNTLDRQTQEARDLRGNKQLQGHSLLSVILTSAASRFCRVTGVTIEEAADLSGLSEDRRSREEPFPKGGQRQRPNKGNLEVMAFLSGDNRITTIYL